MLYGGLGTLNELKKRMTGKPVAKSHDISGELLGELMDTIQTGI